MNSDIVTFTAVTNARLRCPLFGDAPDVQLFWDRLWTARLRIFGRLFPFVGESIKELAGLPRNAVIGGDSDHATNLAYLAAHVEYAKGYRSERPEVRAIHDRQNAEWEILTGLPALGSLNDWRAAAAAAGFPPAEFEQHDFTRIADCILAWAQAKAANRTSPEQAAGPAGKAKTGMTVPEYNVEARKYLQKNPDAGPREMQKALGCGMGTVYKLPAYQAVAAERKKGRKPKAASLTKQMADATTKADGDGELAKLIREQRRDDRTHKVSSRERL